MALGVYNLVERSVINLDTDPGYHFGSDLVIFFFFFNSRIRIRSIVGVVNPDSGIGFGSVSSVPIIPISVS
jgi:hypothetical protein